MSCPAPDKILISSLSYFVNLILLLFSGNILAGTDAADNMELDVEVTIDRVFKLDEEVVRLIGTCGCGYRGKMFVEVVVDSCFFGTGGGGGEYAGGEDNRYISESVFVWFL